MSPAKRATAPRKPDHNSQRVLPGFIWDCLLSATPVSAESILQEPGLEHGAAAERGVEGVCGKAQQQDNPGEPDPRIPGGKLRGYREKPQQEIDCVVRRVRQKTEANQKEADN